MSVASVEEAVAAIGRGEMVIVVDDEDRENEGDLIMAAEHATAERMAFFVRYTSGLICASITAERADELDLPLMVTRNTEAQRTAFTVTVDAKAGTTTGISAADRARTARTLVDPGTRPADLARPGHLHVLRAREGGVLVRAGHTEAAVDLARLAGLIPAGVLAEVVSADGIEMARRPELEGFAAEHGLVMITIADLIRHRRQTEQLVGRKAEARLPTPWGVFRCIAYESTIERETHLAFVMGEPRGADDILVRVHSECLTGDVFGSLRCDCGSQLHAAMQRVAAEGVGVVVYLRGHEGRGIGLAHKLRAYELQDGGLDTVDANLELGLPIDSREYGIGAQILVDLGVTTMRLLTNNPAKRGGLEGFGLRITSRLPIQTEANPENVRYLETKRARMGHLLDSPRGGATLGVVDGGRGAGGEGAAASEAAGGGEAT
ncbi:MAG: bifunctional 3,4-dihydroxy-2-butanone-4-phosphate synthase/GTP cyclohydrolase II [Acidimicrobiaceae bacterium]|nr:bifunctional 3,4-dihydroxy-2-butanone-4-phosphate synthase/GTP cyclohydrolase II [Acidimicrobiaceae bacterium]